MFGETYPDPVRVVSVGPKIDDLLTDKTTPWGMQNSVEFCGGTHVTNSKEQGFLKKFLLCASRNHGASMCKHESENHVESTVCFHAHTHTHTVLFYST